MSNPFFNPSRTRVWKETIKRQPGTATGEHGAREAIIEKIRREEEKDTPAVTKKLFANPSPASGNPPWPPDPAELPIDRFHKRGRNYVTVSPIHPSTDPDPVPDPAAFHSIIEAYAFAKATLVPAMASNTDDRIKIVVFGGKYTEVITCDSTFIDIIGIGRPCLEGGQFIIDQDPDFETMQVLIDNFDVINPVMGEGDDPRDFAGLIIRRGVDSGIHQSNIQIKNCRFRGSAQQAYIERWSDFELCWFESGDNLSTGIPSVEIIFPQPAEDALINRWTQFRNCLIMGMSPDVPLVDPNFFQKGEALRISCVDPTTGNWSSNVLTQESGVLLKDCTVIGYTQNFGWQYHCYNCTLIEGYFINVTAGSIHHLQWCNGTESTIVDAYSWFDHCDFVVRYLAAVTDINLLPVLASCNIWFRNIVHSGYPPIQAPPNTGSQVIDGNNAFLPGAAPAIVNAYGADYSTWMLFLYGPGGVELGILALPGTNPVFGANINIFDQRYYDV